MFMSVKNKMQQLLVTIVFLPLLSPTRNIDTLRQYSGHDSHTKATSFCPVVHGRRSLRPS